MPEDPRKFKKYRMTYPPDMATEDVLLTASQFTTGEPRIYSYPGFAGLYEVGDCDYEGFRDYLKIHGQLWDGKRPGPKISPAKIQDGIEEAKTLARRWVERFGGKNH